MARRLATSVFWLAISLASVHSSLAQSNVISIDWTKPQSQYPVGAGVPVPSSCPVRISLRMSNATPTAACYQPLRFQVRPVAGRSFPSDGTVTLRMKFKTYASGDQVAVVTIPVRAGDTSVESGILMRWGDARSNFELQGAWNGRTYANLSSKGYFMWSGLESRPMQLVVASSKSIVNKSPDMKAAFAAIDDSEIPFGLATLPATTVNSMVNQAVVKCIADIDRMPRNWLALAHFDEIVATVEDLEEMDPTSVQVLQNYLWCGGRIRVQDAQHTSDLGDRFAADWERSVAEPGIRGQIYRAGFGFIVLGKDDHEDLDAYVDNQGYRSRFARVVKTSGDDHWKWLIPAVGKTPIWAFLGLVMLLVGIGAPAILMWSQKMQRRVWTILAIPVLSLVSIMTLFVYAAAKDGWRSLVRVRSLTLLDADGQGAVWSRQTYFAGQIPDGKIRVGAEVELIPLQGMRGTNTVQYQDGSGEKQIHSGILTLRQQKQVSLTHRVRDLEILRMGNQIEATTGMPITKNASQSMLLAVVCSDSNGRVFRAEKISPDQLVAWQETDEASAGKWLKSFYDAQPLRLPPDAPEIGSNSLFQWLRSPYPVWGSGVSSAGFEEETYWTQELASWGPESRCKFVAVIDRAPQLEKCLENVEETSSLHMVIGRWRPPAPEGSETSRSSDDSPRKGLQPVGFGEK